MFLQCSFLFLLADGHKYNYSFPHMSFGLDFSVWSVLELQVCSHCHDGSITPCICMDFRWLWHFQPFALKVFPTISFSTAIVVIVVDFAIHLNWCNCLNDIFIVIVLGVSVVALGREAVLFSILEELCPTLREEAARAAQLIIILSKSQYG